MVERRGQPIPLDNGVHAKKLLRTVLIANIAVAIKAEGTVVELMLSPSTDGDELGDVVGEADGAGDVVGEADGEADVGAADGGHEPSTSFDAPSPPPIIVVGHPLLPQQVSHESTSDIWTSLSTSLTPLLLKSHESPMLIKPPDINFRAPPSPPLLLLNTHESPMIAVALFTQMAPP
jgi:hypothetical protein